MLVRVSEYPLAMPTWVKQFQFKCKWCKLEKFVEKETLYPRDAKAFKKPSNPKCYNTDQHGSRSFHKFGIMKFENVQYYKRWFVDGEPTDRPVSEHDVGRPLSSECSD